MISAGQTASDSHKAVVVTFDEGWLNTAMPLNGEHYYLHIQGKVKDNVKAGTEMKFFGTTVFNAQKPTAENPEGSLGRKRTSNATCKVGEVKDSLALDDLTQEYKYEITTLVPENATAITITDTLEDVLEVVGTPSLTGNADVKLIVEGRTVKCVINNATPLRGQPVTLTIQARIMKGVTPKDLYTKYGMKERKTQIPNYAEVSYTLENQKSFDFTTNEAVVVPPFDDFTIKKVDDNGNPLEGAEFAIYGLPTVTWEEKTNP